MFPAAFPVPSVGFTVATLHAEVGFLAYYKTSAIHSSAFPILHYIVDILYDRISWHCNVLRITGNLWE